MGDVDAALVCSLKTLHDSPELFPWTIREHAGMGRSVFATRDIEAGETLAFDEPLLYWEEDEPIGSPVALRIIEACGGRVHNNVVNLLSVYCSSSADVRDRLGDFMTISPPEAHFIAPMTAVWTGLADKIWPALPDLHDVLPSPGAIVDLLTRSHLNAHNFYTGHVMLEVASKFNHSCVPNATYNKVVAADDSRTSFMRIFTIRDICAGEQIFSTYIGGQDMLASTRDRRAQLRAAKAFVCRCERCTAPDELARLPCPACGDADGCVRFDAVEHPWRCSACGRRFWDAEVTVRESQLRRLVANLDADMTLGRFPPLQIVRFVVRDALTDLGRGHYLAVQARLLLEELYAFRALTGALEPDEAADRVANAWSYVAFVMDVVWRRVSPVVACNLSALRLRVLLEAGEGGPPPGVPVDAAAAVLDRADVLLRSFWGPADEDAAACRRARALATSCRACDRRLPSTTAPLRRFADDDDDDDDDDAPQEERLGLAVCGGCAGALYCSRACQVRDRERHASHCELARAVAEILRRPASF